MLTVVPQGLGSNPGEDMGVCKCIASLRQGSTLNSRRVASPLVGLLERKERWEASGHPQGFFPLNWVGTEQNRTATCMVIKANINDRRKNILALNHDEFRGPPSDFVSYMRAFDDGLRNFEPWSSDEDITRAGTPHLLTTTPSGGRLRSQLTRPLIIFPGLGKRTLIGRWAS
ncbi:uncharacterized protein TNCV_1065511 [Trichonephila clavipes]|nr:uncharacterized protein TNCV_1065511 [Trichonephila clavipes]